MDDLFLCSSLAYSKHCRCVLEESIDPINLFGLSTLCAYPLTFAEDSYNIRLLIQTALPEYTHHD